MVNLAVVNVGIMLGFVCLFFKVFSPTYPLLVSFKLNSQMLIHVFLLFHLQEMHFPSQIPKKPIPPQIPLLKP